MTLALTEEEVNGLLRSSRVSYNLRDSSVITKKHVTAMSNAVTDTINQLGAILTYRNNISKMHQAQLDAEELVKKAPLSKSVPIDNKKAGNVGAVIPSLVELIANVADAVAEQGNEISQLPLILGRGGKLGTALKIGAGVAAAGAAAYGVSKLSSPSLSLAGRQAQINDNIQANRTAMRTPALPKEDERGWWEKIKDFFTGGRSADNAPTRDGAPATDQNGNYGTSRYAPIPNLDKIKGDWKNDTAFLKAIDDVSREHDIDAGDLLGIIRNESAGTFSPTVMGPENKAVGLFQFTSFSGFNIPEISRMSRAQQVYLANERIFKANKLPKGANAGQIYASIYLPARARKVKWSMTDPLTQSGEKYYDKNRGLDVNRDGYITITDLANKVSGHREAMGIGQSVSRLDTPLEAPVPTGLGTWSPLSSLVYTSHYGMRSRGNHRGVDLRAKTGTPVYAWMDGNVSLASGGNGGYGNLITINHADGFSTRYAHLSSFKVAKSDQVKAGQIIGFTGGARGAPGAGNSEAEHLHFEILKNGKQVNPEPYLKIESEKSQNLRALSEKMDSAKKGKWPGTPWRVPAAPAPAVSPGWHAPMKLPPAPTKRTTGADYNLYLGAGKK